MAVARFLLLLGLLALPLNVSGHRLDEYLQATLVTIEPDALRLQINLTPGVAVAEQVLALIDTNRNGMVSTNEAKTYVDNLKRHLIVRLDDREIELKLAGSNFPPVPEVRAGSGIIQVEFVGKIDALSAGPHRMKFENQHMSTIGVYLFNAAQSRIKSVEIRRQTRSRNQSVGEIEFTYDAKRG
jgi:hypothetical protein